MTISTQQSIRSIINISVGYTEAYAKTYIVETPSSAFANTILGSRLKASTYPLLAPIKAQTDMSNYDKAMSIYNLQNQIDDQGKPTPAAKEAQSLVAAVK